MMVATTMSAQTPLLSFVEANVKYVGGEPDNYFTTEFQIDSYSDKYVVSLEGAKMDFAKSTVSTRQYQNLIINRFGDENRMLYLTIDFETNDLLFVNFIVAKTASDGNKQYIDWVQWWPNCKQELTRSTAGK